MGVDVLIQIVDVFDEIWVDEVMVEVFKKFGCLDICIVNVGML